MKRVYCFTAFILLLCLPILLSAQLPKGVNIPVGKTNGGPTWYPISIDGCEVTFEFTLVVFNLDLLNPVSGFNGGPDVTEYSLPVGYDPMYLECIVNGFGVMVEVESFQYYPDMDNKNGRFTFIHRMTIDVSEECEDASASELLSFSVELSLLKENLSEYPICDYMSSDDIFDCNYLPVDDCPLIECTPSYWMNWNGIRKIKCGDDCGNSDPEEMDNSGKNSLDGRGTNIESRNHLDSENEISKDLEVYPNPFNAELNFKWNSTSENSKFRLYDTKGQLMKSWFNSRHQEGETMKISTNELPKGVYFLIIENDDKTIHHKLIKT